MTAPRTRLVVAAAIVDDLRWPSLLLGARRSSPPALAGRWEFPGGKVEPGEEPPAALARELAEELGVGLRAGPMVPAPGEIDGDWPLPNRMRMRLWLAEIDGAPRPLQDHDELRWLDVRSLHDVPWLTADLDAVDAVGALMVPRPA